MRPRFYWTFTSLFFLAGPGLVYPGCRKKDPPPDTREEAPPLLAKGLKIHHVRLMGAGGERPDRAFARGESLIARLLVTGVTARNRRVDMRAAIRVTGPGNVAILERPEFVAIQKEVPAGKSTHTLEAALQLALSRASPPGAYMARVTLRDAVADARKTVKISFQIHGLPGAPPTQFSLRRFQAPRDTDLIAGLPLHLSLEAAGFALRKVTGGRYRAHVTAQAVLLDGSGVERARHRRKLLHDTLGFRARSVPLSWPIPLPAQLPPGSYYLKVTLKDEVSGNTTSAEHRFKLLPGGFGVYGLRLMGSAGIHRRSFLRGERILVRGTVQGAKSPAQLSVDVGLVGPDRGFYLVRKNALEIRQDPAKKAPTGRELSIPLIVPEFAPNGRFTLKLRLRDHRNAQQASRDLSFTVTGKPLRRLPNLQATQMTLRRRPQGPTIPGFLLRAGEQLHAEVIVGGMRLRPEAGYYHRTHLSGTLRLVDRAGKVRAVKRGACEIKRRFSFVPLRLRLRTSWRIPTQLLGRHQFQFSVLDHLSDRVTMRQRNVFILKQRRTP